MNISKIILSNKMLCKLACFSLRFMCRNYYNKMKDRIHADLFDYKKIAQPLPKHYDEICPDNNCFGIGWCLRKYVGWPKKYINQFVEHGYFYGSYVSSQEIDSFADTILTFGDVRVKHLLKKCKKKIIPIGPYVHYAPDYYGEEEFEKIKKELGRTLLVFFSHSATGQTVEFDLDYMINRIESIRDDFDSVVVSLFWSDINNEVVDKLTKKGYRIFSSGHRYDYLFLSRQKTMIKLADVTMSNSVGTHIAYCTYFKKPHWIINQEIKKKENSAIGKKNKIISQQINSDLDYQKEVQAFFSMFEKYSKELSSEQYIFVSQFFGFNHVKTETDLYDIINS